MKMRLISLALVVVMVGIALTGCATTTEAAAKNPFAGRFSAYSVGDAASVLVDRVEGVCYLYTCTFRGGCAITIMLDEDGYPVTYSEVKYAAD